MSPASTVQRASRKDRGAVAVIVALTMSAILITGAIVLEFALVRYDRQIDKSVTDDAAMAGLHAADDGSGAIHNASAVCEAYEFLKSSRNDLSGLPADSCATVNTTQTCTPGDATTNAAYHDVTAAGTKHFEVWIKMPYQLTDTSTNGGFANESSMTTLSSDPGDSTQQGCDQIGVVIEEWTQPGLGKIVHSGDLVTKVRSVGRVKISNGDVPPALLLLEQHSCSVLVVGSGGSPSRIQVKGSGTTPGSIHSDSDATGAGCGSGPNQQLMQGKQSNGVVAYGGSGGASGIITSVASDNGRDPAIVSDGITNVYGTTGVFGGAAGTPSSVSPRRLVTRKPVDKRYLPGVTAAAISAWQQWQLNHASPGAPWTRTGCSPSAADLALTTPLYIDCTGGSGITLGSPASPVVINASRIFFNGWISAGNISMPNATQVYVSNTDTLGNKIKNNAIQLNNNNAFCMRATACLTATPATGQCSTAPTGISTHGQLMIRRGFINGAGNSSLLRLCNTTVIMEGGNIGDGTAANPGACLPATNGTPPTSTPCPVTGPGPASTPTGSGQINTTGVADWTAPNQYGVMTDAQKQPAWDGGEDLALWTESSPGSPPDGTTYQLAGGSSIHVAGVFMAPNAAPFSIAGGGTQDLTNAQFVCTSFAVGGGALLTMQVDPNNAVGAPTLSPFTLVR